MRIREIMNKAFAVDEDISIREAAEIMGKKGVGSLILMEKKKVVGIVTERDILKNISKAGRKVSTIMSKKVVYIDPNEAIENAAELMAAHKIRRLPVINKDKLIGIITATDLLAHSDEIGESFLFD